MQDPQPPRPLSEPYLIYPLDPTPEMIAELGAQCSHCGLVHDVTGRITGDRVWCPCGEWLTVRHTARVVAPPPPPCPGCRTPNPPTTYISRAIRCLVCGADMTAVIRADWQACDEDLVGDLADGHALPTTHTRTLVMAPAPFHQLARRCYRLRIDIPRGYAAGLLAGNLPWYRVVRRRVVRRSAYPARDLVRRRRVARQCIRDGYVPMGNGVFYDPAADVAYGVASWASADYEVA